MSAPTHDDWVEANQKFLVAEFARIKALLGDGDVSTATVARDECRAALPAQAAIDTLSETFALSNFERDIVLLCAGVEMDAGIAALCAQGQASTRPWASFGLAVSALPGAHWDAIAPMNPLRRWRLLDLKDENALASARLSIDERVLHYLAGINYLDIRLQALLRPRQTGDTMADAHRSLARSLVQALQNPALTSTPLTQLSGDDVSGQQDIAAAAAAEFGLQLYILRAADIPTETHELDALTILWQREAALLGGALLIECADEHSQRELCARLAERTTGAVFIATRQPVEVRRSELRFRVSKPHAADQKRLWRAALGNSAQRLNGSLEGVSTQFRFDAQTISRTGQMLRTVLDGSETPDADLWRACRDSGRNRLDDLAQRVEPGAAWNDLILPDAEKSILRQIAAHVKHRLKVYQDWGFAAKSNRGLGIGVLFAGESGTGKTMAAEVLASELNLDVYRVDLASVVSKYIGETEKNLRRVFDAGEESGAILLFDEADALFGKRSEVRDSHDRHANIEVSYLLQRMETYSGLAILTTNQKTALDKAFHRRLRFVVQFPFPDLKQREQIWRGMIPDATPVDGIDHAKLARLNVTGGNIRNIALNAAFAAAEDGQALAMHHLLHAARAEGAKRERPVSDTEVRGWV